MNDDEDELSNGVSYDIEDVGANDADNYMMTIILCIIVTMQPMTDMLI